MLPSFAFSCDIHQPDFYKRSRAFRALTNAYDGELEAFAKFGSSLNLSIQKLLQLQITRKILEEHHKHVFPPKCPRWFGGRSSKENVNKTHFFKKRPKAPSVNIVGSYSRNLRFLLYALYYGRTSKFGRKLPTRRRAFVKREKPWNLL